MAPGGLVIQKLALQATVDDELLKGLLCMKISIPKDVDGSTAKLPLYPEPKIGTLAAAQGLADETEVSPQYLSPHPPYPLPLTPAHLSNRHLLTASTLLGFPLPSSPSSRSPHHPSTSGSPTPASSSRIQVQVETTRPEGPVYIAVQGGKRRRPSVGSNGSSGRASIGGIGGARKEYVLVMQVEHDVRRKGNGAAVDIPLPKCLDNVLRLQLCPSTSSAGGAMGNGADTGDVDLLVEPKLLSLPPDTFVGLANTRQAVSGSDGGAANGRSRWADGESSASEMSASGDEADLDGDGDDCWIEGRFQGTDNLHLEWAFSNPSPIPHLHLCPDLADRSIGFTYDAPLRLPHIPSSTSSAERRGQMRRPSGADVPLLLDVPAGWGVAELSIRAEGLQRWVCADDPSFCAHAHGPISASRAMGHNLSANGTNTDDGELDTEPDDSFSTVRPPLPSTSTDRGQALPRATPPKSHAVRSSASLMHQTLPLPDVSMNDFSFELGDHSREAVAGNGHGNGYGHGGVNGAGHHGLGNGTGVGSGAGVQEPGGMWTPMDGQGVPELSASVPRSRAVAAREITLHFNPALMDRTAVLVLVHGLLVPLRPDMLVSPSILTKVPTINLPVPSTSADTERLSLSFEGDPSGPRYLDVRTAAEMDVVWRDRQGRQIPLPKRGRVGDVSIKVSRDVWGLQHAAVELEWPLGAEEVVLVIPASRSNTSGEAAEAVPELEIGVDGEEAVRIVSATVSSSAYRSTVGRGACLHHATVRTSDGYELYLAKPTLATAAAAATLARGRASEPYRRGDAEKVKVVVEGALQDRVLLPCPHLRDTEGEQAVQVELVGHHWDGLLSSDRGSDPVDPRVYTFPLCSKAGANFPHLALSPSSLAISGQAKTAPTTSFSRPWSWSWSWSWSALVNLFLLYLLLSLAQQVQRLRHEVAFVKDEYGDLRTYAAAAAAAAATPASGGGRYGAHDHDHPRPHTPVGSSESSNAYGGSAPRNGAHAESTAAGPSPVTNTPPRHVDDQSRPGNTEDRWQIRTDEGLPRYDWRDGGVARLERDWPVETDEARNAGRGHAYGHGGHAIAGNGPNGWRTQANAHARPDPMGIGRVVVGQSAWDKFAAHPTVRTIEQSIRWVWGTVIWLLNPAR